MCRVSSKIGASSRRTCRSATDSAPPETATRTVSPPASIAWRRMVRSTWTRGPTRLAALESHPDLAVLEVLLLPDRDGALERIDRISARVERVAAVGGGDGDEHARLADLEPADAVEHRDPLHAGPAPSQARADLARLHLGHRGVRLVFEERRGPTAGLVPDHSREDDDAARSRIVHLGGNRLGGQRLGDDAIDVGAGAAAHGRKQTEFVV